jgi:hypothetical protein
MRESRTIGGSRCAAVAYSDRVHRSLLRALPLLIATLGGIAEHAAAVPPAGAPAARDRTAPQLVLAAAPPLEREILDRLRHSQSWVRRAFAAERLARFDCEESAELLRGLVRDEAWRVRAFATLACARRQIELPATTFEREPEVRVLRTALRCRYELPAGPLTELIRRLARSARLEDQAMALELAVASPLDIDGRDAVLDAKEFLGDIIMRMDRVEAGSLSPRLAAITDGKDSGRSYRWRDWYRKNRRDPGLHGAFLVTAGSEPRGRGPIAELALDRFAELERHMQDLSGRAIEIAIAIDCTASMSGELAECQSGIDALMLFAQDVARSARIGIVGYRDEKDDWETRGWDLTPSIDEARDALWTLSADGGGDRPESVLAGLKLAYGRMSWTDAALRSLVVVGDAPPRPGTGDQSVELARRAFAAGIRTFTIAPRAPSEPQPTVDAPAATPPDPPPAPAPAPAESEPEPNRYDRPGPAPWSPASKRRPTSPWRQKLPPGAVEYWKEIAEAGGGRTVGLPRDASLIAEIAGLTLGDDHQTEFESFFASWFALCR